MRLMFGRWLKSAVTTQAPEGAEALKHVVEAQLPEADQESVLVVTAIAGLLGAVAYADRDYSSAEEQRVHKELARVHGMTQAGIDAICETLRQHIVEVSTVQAPRYSRLLVELGDRELRLEVLEVLVELAAADGELSVTEVNVLRQITTALGLSQGDYNAAQDKHRERLTVLKGSSR
jgi:uncharacterized tellurite resistance protein B-like protein